jgi:hypothetical protein
MQQAERQGNPPAGIEALIEALMNPVVARQRKELLEALNKPAPAKTKLEPDPMPIVPRPIASRAQDLHRR